MKIAVIDDYQGAFSKTKAYPKLKDHEGIYGVAIDQIVAFAVGKPINVVNPDALVVKR